MMLFKLSVRNIIKSIQNYLIYFVTLILGVAIFYVFNALGSQTIMLNVSSDTHDVIKMMNDTMSAVSVFVSFILGFLIVYASAFLMKRRKKEFGIYMLLGMGKSKVSAILIIETVLIGIVSLAAGLLVGAAVSQGMSIVVANMFEADMTRFQFVVSGEAIAKTIIYFLVIYVIVIALDIFVVGKTRLINLVNAAKQSEKNHAKNPIICLIVFVMACGLLASAYYNVTKGAGEIKEASQFGVQILKGIIGTFMVFWSLSGMIILVARKNKRLYYKGVNSFSIREFDSRINTTVFSGGIICILLFFTICILSSAMAIKKSVNASLEECAVKDVQLRWYISDDELANTDINDSRLFENYLLDKGVDLSKLTSDTEVHVYYDEDIKRGDVVGEAIDDKSIDDFYRDYLRRAAIGAVHLSDYNRFAKSYGAKQYELAEDEYILVCDYNETEKMFNNGLSYGSKISINGKEYSPKYNVCQDGFVEISDTHANVGFVIVPDDVRFTHLESMEFVYSADYSTHNKSEYTQLNKYYDEKNIKKIVGGREDGDDAESIRCLTKQYLYDTSVGLTIMIIFVGIYLGIIFLISSAAILALKELSEATDNREKYKTLRRIGVDEKQISHSLMLQCGMFFGLPLLLAIIHSIFGMQTAMIILQYFGHSGLLFSILFAAAVILVIYGIYFFITYSCSRKIISE